MSLSFNNLKFTKLEDDQITPYDLLLLADPLKELVDEYLEHSDIFIAINNDDIIGIIVLYPLSAVSVEIKNLAVKPELQGKGIGNYLIENAVKVAHTKGIKSICIGTANSSIGQLYLYQKHGFEITEIKRNFFIDNYPEIIMENGIQAKHMLVLTRQLDNI